MTDDGILNTGMDIPITTRRNTDFVMTLDFTPTDITAATVEVSFSGASVLPTATVTKAETTATVLVPKAAVEPVQETCRYLVTYTDSDGITTPCLGGTFRVID